MGTKSAYWQPARGGAYQSYISGIRQGVRYAEKGPSARAGHRAQGTGHRAQGTGHRAQGTGHRAQGTGHRAQGAGHRAQGTGRRVQGTGHRAKKMVRGKGYEV
jgi:hypothetical protein